MTDAPVEGAGTCVRGHAGLTAEINANGSLRRFECGGISLLLFVGNELEGEPTNLYLRKHGSSADCIPSPRASAGAAVLSSRHRGLVCCGASGGRCGAR